MPPKFSLNALWKSAVSENRSFHLADRASLPAAAQRYLEHAIAPDTPLASAVRLQMHGEIKLKQWYPFQAEQVTDWNRGMIWRATTWMNGLPVWGFDRLVDGEGVMQWKLLGLLPVMMASGKEIARSGAGRWGGEAVWLPSVLWSDSVIWTSNDAAHATASFTRLNESIDLNLEIESDGHLKGVQLQRWGNLDGNEFGYASFGGFVEAEGTFCGYTIPTQMRLGWYFGSKRFEAEGEFFRVTIDNVQYR